MEELHYLEDLFLGSKTKKENPHTNANIVAKDESKQEEVCEKCVMLTIHRLKKAIKLL